MVTLYCFVPLFSGVTVPMLQALHYVKTRKKSKLDKKEGFVLPENRFFSITFLPYAYLSLRSIGVTHHYHPFLYFTKTGHRLKQMNKTTAP